MDAVSVREAGPADAEGFAALLDGLAGERLDDVGITVDTRPVPPGAAVKIMKVVSAVGGGLLLAEAGGTLAGFLMLVGSGDARWLTMAVARDRRRSGIGRALLRGAVGWGRERGLAGLRLVVRRHNAPAIGLYGETGFEEEAGTEEEQLRWRESNSMGMRLDLGP